MIYKVLPSDRDLYKGNSETTKPISWSTGHPEQRAPRLLIDDCATAFYDLSGQVVQICAQDECFDFQGSSVLRDDGGGASVTSGASSVRDPAFPRRSLGERI